MKRSTLPPQKMNPTREKAGKDTPTLPTNAQADRLPDVIVANLNRNFTGVTATLHNVVPNQLALNNSMAVYGPNLGLGEPHVSFSEMMRYGRTPPKNKPFRIWHARRNTDLWRGLFFRDVMNMPLKILFTSAAQRRHSLIPRLLLNRADAYIATTEKAASHLKQTDAVIPHGIDLALFSPPENKILAWQHIAETRGWPGKYAIGQLGRIRAQKGTDIFVDALIKILPRFPDAVGVITGTAKPKEKAYKDRMLAKISAANLQDRIIWTGQLSIEELHAVQRALSLFVAAARREEFGLTPAEALACGTPVICSDTGAFASMAIPGRTGTLIPTNKTEPLIQAMTYYLDNPELMAAMSANCREHAEQQFDAKREATDINKLYEQLWSQA